MDVPGHIFGSLIAFTAYMTLLARASVALATSYTLVNPVIALLLGVGFAGETVTHQEWLAAGIVVIGVVTLIIGKQRNQPLRSAEMLADEGAVDSA